MSNSTTKAAEKRERLVESAKSLFYEQGVSPTTLAEVAERAQVPLGNVYYYFKTKEQIVAAVVASRTVEVRETHCFVRSKTDPAGEVESTCPGLGRDR